MSSAASLVCPHVQAFVASSTAAMTGIIPAGQQVYREACVLCVHDQKRPGGVNVCLSTFQCFCQGPASYNHAALHCNKTGHMVMLNIQRKAYPSPTSAPASPSDTQGEDDERPKKLTKLHIPATDKPTVRYHDTLTLYCHACNMPECIPEATVPTHDPAVIETMSKDSVEMRNVPDILVPLANAVLNAMPANKATEIKAWEEAPLVVCPHAAAGIKQERRENWHTGLLNQCMTVDCGIKENLWLCLTCGNVGCGRKQYDGTGGEGHGAEHGLALNHPLSVKLGTITAEGEADVHCYLCGEMTIDPNLNAHLATFGMHIGSLQKTEKSLAELQLEQNLKFDFNMMAEDGVPLEPCRGPGFLGLTNLGNSCYLASVVQVLLHTPSVLEQLYSVTPMETLFKVDGDVPQEVPALLAQHYATCDEARSTDSLVCQLGRIALAIWQPPTEAGASDAVHAEVKPMLLKQLLGAGHEEFSTMRQQDAMEFLSHIWTLLQRHAQRPGAHRAVLQKTLEAFSFVTQQRIMCTGCGGVRYKQLGVDPTEASYLSLRVPATPKPDAKADNGKAEDGKEEAAEAFEKVSIQQCLRTAGEAVPVEFSCPTCGKTQQALKEDRYLTLPDVMVVMAHRFVLENWVPKKQSVPITFPGSNGGDSPCVINMEPWRERVIGVKPGETALAEDSADTSSNATAAPAIDEGALSQLLSMGFPDVRCRKALLATHNNGAEMAMQWLFEHMDDPDIDAPIESTPAPAAAAAGPDPESMVMLQSMGFNEGQAKRALKETDGNVERAVDWLFSHPEITGHEVEEAEPLSDASAEAVVPTLEERVAAEANVSSDYELYAFVSHKGTSIHCGHYVAHIRHPSLGWVMFNDARVVRTPQPPLEHAYIYFFQRKKTLSADQA